MIACSVMISYVMYYRFCAGPLVMLAHDLALNCRLFKTVKSEVSDCYTADFFPNRFTPLTYTMLLLDSSFIVIGSRNELPSFPFR